jgi:branched-chain amino acid transport system ATP-binding protein
VDNVSLDLARGELHALIGPNGAGKSTFLNLLSGEIRPSAGQVLLNGADVTAWPVWRRARAGIGRSFQRTDVMREMTVADNVRLAAQARLARGLALLRPARGAAAIDAAASAALARVGMAGRAGQRAGALGHGELRQVEIAMALATAPAALLLDEPLAGMGPEDVAAHAALLRTLAADHAVLLVEHDMDVVFAIADRVSVLVDGAILASGPPAQIRASAAVRAAYLGEGA